MIDGYPAHPLVEMLWPRVDADEARDLERELRAELGDDHPLAHRDLRLIGAADGTDDVLLIMTTDTGAVFVEVHLTWNLRPEQFGCPTFKVFDSLEALIAYARMLVRSAEDAR